GWRAGCACLAGAACACGALVGTEARSGTGRSSSASILTTGWVGGPDVAAGCGLGAVVAGVPCVAGCCGAGAGVAWEVGPRDGAGVAGCGLGVAAGFASEALAFCAIDFTDSACPWTSRPRLWRKSRSLVRNDDTAPTSAAAIGGAQDAVRA